MKINCCYRCTPTGEAIHTYIDSKTFVADLIPKSFYNPEMLELPEYSPYNYTDKKEDWAAMCEAILLSNDKFAIVVEDNTIGYLVLQFDGWYRFLESPMDEQDKGRFLIKPNTGNFKTVGYRRTKLIQFRSCSGVYRLTLDTTNNTFITNDGILTPEFNIDDLSSIDYNYLGYKEMIKRNVYAIVYHNGLPMYLRKTDDNRLVVL